MTSEGQSRSRTLSIHLGLFAATCATTYWAGRLSFGGHAGGMWFAGTLMAVLLCHEMGHYLVARWHGIDASLPYFIPLPPFVSLGTMGAVIAMGDTIRDRNQLIDVGASGPLAGLVVAVPALLIGLDLSPLINEPAVGAVTEGNSIAYLALKWVVTGQILPAADGTDVDLHPMAFAAWVGLLLTMINLIPIGQLDGGHIARGYLGQKHEAWSLWLHRALLVAAAAAGAYASYLAMDSGMEPGAAVQYGASSAVPWLVWALLLWVMKRRGGQYHPPVAETPLAPSRKWLVWAMAVIFVLIFTPIPLRESLP